MKVIEDVIDTIIKKSICTSYRLCKVIELTQNESESISVKNGYIFWCFIHLERKKPMFLFAQFSIVFGEIVWSYRFVKFQQWAAKAYKRGWFDRIDVRRLEIKKEVTKWDEVDKKE